MTARSIALSLLLTFAGFIGPLEAQQAQPTAPAASAIDVSKLPLNLTRLQMQLQAASSASSVIRAPELPSPLQHRRARLGAADPALHRS
jgi:hypothetical protein